MVGVKLHFGTIIECIYSVKTLTKIAFLTLLLAATSCASRKKTVAPTPATTFEWLTSKVEIDIEGKNMTFDDLSGQLRMRHDSLVWLSVTAPMGIEVARIKVSTDSVWVINRLEKTYLAEPLDSVAQCLGMPISLHPSACSTVGPTHLRPFLNPDLWHIWAWCPHIQSRSRMVGP